MTWNLQGSKRTDLERVAAETRDRRPDVVLLQEVRRPQAATLANLLDLHHEWAFKHHPIWPFFPGRAEGAAILTPHDLTDRGAEVVSDATSRWNWRRRIVMWATVHRDGESIRAMNAHLSPHDLRGERLDEADRIATIADSLGTPPPLVLGGDFNDHGDPEPLERLPGVEHVPSPPTNPADDPRNVLDHVLLPADAADVELEVPAGGPQWDDVSDHLPVTVGFTLPRGD